MFRTFSSRDAASLGVSGMEYEQLVCAAGSVFMFLVKAADWNFYKRGYNQYQGNIMEMVDFAFRHQTQSEQIYPKSLPLRSSAANIRSPIIQVPPAKRQVTYISSHIEGCFAVHVFPNTKVTVSVFRVHKSKTWISRQFIQPTNISNLSIRRFSSSCKIMKKEWT